MNLHIQQCTSQLAGSHVSKAPLHHRLSRVHTCPARHRAWTDVESGRFGRVVTSFASDVSTVEVAPASTSASTELEPGHYITELTKENFEEFLVSNGPNGLVMIDFYTDLCGPCKFMVPHYEKMSRAFRKIKFGKFNCGHEGHEALARRYRIRAMPSFSLFYGGTFLEQVTGAGPVQLRQLLVHYNR